jgi:ABC-2 type transport system permease protein
MNDQLIPIPVNQPLLFQRLRWRLLRNAFRALTQRGSMRVIAIILCSLLVWAAVFAISMDAFLFLRSKDLLLGGTIIGLVLDFLFLFLTVMLIGSTGIILYSSLFVAAETAFLLSTRAAADQVFVYKLQGAIGFSSWAFVLLGSPVLVAAGLVYEVPWYFYVLLPCFFLGFVLLPGSVGALCCLLVANYIPRRRKQVLLTAAGALLLLGGLGGWWTYRAVKAVKEVGTDPVPTADTFQRIMDQLSFSEAPLMPSHWMTRGLQAAAHGNLLEVGYGLALVWSNGLFSYLVTAWAAARLYRRGYNRVATWGGLRRRYGSAWLDRLATAPVPFLHPQVRLLIIKDFRVFRRDPVQWVQILIFAGLLGLYFANIRGFYHGDIPPIYQNGVSMLNLTATGLLLCAYTGRFIFPMLSLEGRKFWILGLLPLRRERLLWGKFAFSAIGALVTAESLILLSDMLLYVSSVTLLLHVLTVAVLAVGVSGLSVGLGASMPNFRESDPSKIAVGFGGTLNLVASLLFLVVTLALMAVPWHFYAVAGDQPFLKSTVVHWLLGAGVLAGVAVGAVVTVLPLRTGMRALRRMEF